jgi:methylmalonyl-CoA carboxyltransferase large subunit
METQTLSVEDLHQQVEDLTRRIERLETELASVRALATRPVTSAPPETGGNGHQPPAPRYLPPDVVLAISAAVAAYLGKRAVIRQIHFAEDSPWAQQGRAAVQTSHLVHGFR